MTDQDALKKILTHKSGQFVFSPRHNHLAAREILLPAEAVYRAVADLPILPAWAAQLDEELIRRSIFSTAAIEGNPLDQAQVKNTMYALLQPQNGSPELEILNLKTAYARYADYPAQPDPLDLSQDMIKDIHALITQGLAYPDNIPGQYRNTLVKVGDAEHGGMYLPPKILADIKTLMTEFIAWINSPEIKALHPGVRASLAHYHLGLIHPFRDGNGRAARLVEAMMLSASGLRFVPKMLSNHYYQNIHEYFTVFRECEKNGMHDLSAFINFFCRGFSAAVDEIKANISWRIRSLALRDWIIFLKKEKIIIARQYDLIDIILETSKPVSLTALYTDAVFKNLYAKVSEQTARRDLNKLLDLNLLRRDGPAYILNRESFEKPRP